MKRGTRLLALILVCFSVFLTLNTGTAYAMPFYGLNPKRLTLRAQFYTSYTSSSAERKHNIALAVSSIDGAFIDVGGEFSFNYIVGARTEKRGYKSAKIISKGKFVDGVGGGVCQVSTTLYNAVLLAGLKIIEFHPHSLPVSYVAPSFDAMVNSGSADLRFKNNTDNPVIIHAVADGSTVTIKIIGEPMQALYERRSQVVGEITPPEPEITPDDNGEYPELYEGDTKVISYGKSGLKSEGYLTKIVNGKVVWVKRIRRDTYSPLRGQIILGKTPRPIIDDEACEIEKNTII